LFLKISPQAAGNLKIYKTAFISLDLIPAKISVYLRLTE